MVEDIRGDHQFVSAGSPDEIGQSAPNGIRRADDRTGQRVIQHRTRITIEKLIDVCDRRRQFARLTAA
jgi:hypothetical protein